MSVALKCQFERHIASKVFPFSLLIHCQCGSHPLARCTFPKCIVFRVCVDMSWNGIYGSRFLKGQPSWQFICIRNMICTKDANATQPEVCQTDVDGKTFIGHEMRKYFSHPYFISTSTANILTLCHLAACSQSTADAIELCVVCASQHSMNVLLLCVYSAHWVWGFDSGIEFLAFHSSNFLR